MEIVLYIFLGITCLALVYLFYLLYRNNKTLKFRLMIIHGGYNYLEHFINNDYYVTDEEYEEHHRKYVSLRDKVDDIIHRYDYNNMLLSFKPLKLEKWFTPEEVELISKYPNEE